MDAVSRPIRPSRHADGAGARGLPPLDPLPAARPVPARLARPRPLRALLRPRLDAALRAAPPHRLRPPASKRSSASGSGARRRRATRSTATPPASRPPPARSARASPTPSGWRSPSGSWRDRFNGRATKSSTTAIWVIASDGDMMEGVASEAASLAGHLAAGQARAASTTTTTSPSTARPTSPSARTSASASRPTAGRCCTWRRQRSRGDRRGARHGRAPRRTGPSLIVAAHHHRLSGARPSRTPRRPTATPLGEGRGRRDQGDPGLAAEPRRSSCRRRSARGRRAAANAPERTRGANGNAVRRAMRRGDPRRRRRVRPSDWRGGCPDDWDDGAADVPAGDGRWPRGRPPARRSRR